MESVIVRYDFQIDINRDKVMQLIDCYKDSPIYEETIEEYEELKPHMLGALSPGCVLVFSTISKEQEVVGVLPEDSPVLYSIATIGHEASALSERYFREGDYLKGMLADAMADACIFGMEEHLLSIIKEECQKRHVGIRHRYEAPVDIPMEYQKNAYEETNAKQYLNMELTSGYMLSPLKTSCQVFGITQDSTMFQLEHDCRKCSNLTCKLRHIPDSMIIIYDKNYKKQATISCKPEESLLEALVSSEIYVSAPCGGHGTCGKCKIQLCDGSLPITSSDRQFFSNEELEKGYRLSCKAYPTEDCGIVLLQNKEEQFEVLGAKAQSQIDLRQIQGDVAFAIDIGTTTIAISLIMLDGKTIVDTYTTVNHQRAYGSDVISRIQASNEGKSEELRKSIQKDLTEGMNHLIKQYQIKEDQIIYITIACNTTMGHLLLGFSCKNLGVVPFTPVDISLMKHSFVEIFGVEQYSNVEVIFLPGISTYVGADIVSGIYACGMNQQEEYCVLIDLGTNGEMAIGNQNGFLVTSTAVGPAFEGGNITWGMGGVPGAISGVELKDDDVTITTIGNQPPLGLCGTGVIEAVAELVKQELIEDTGLLDEDYFEDGFLLATTDDGDEIVLTQKDIREIQLAKSAVRAGLEVLIKRAGITYDKVKKVYIAGGFGFKINQEKATVIGMFPEELQGKIEAVGNTSLMGAIKYLHQGKNDDILEKIAEKSQEINLSMDKDFNELYVDYMFFE